MIIGVDELRSGQQCLLRVWRAQRSPVAAASPEALAGRLAAAEVRRLATALFPEARDADAAEWQERLRLTRSLVTGDALGIRNAAFEAGGARVTVDVLERDPRGGWTVVLVRHAVRVSSALADRAALTLHVMRQAGLRVAAVHALLVNPAYVRAGQPIDVRALTVRRSISFVARRRLAGVANRLATIGDVVRQPEPPPVTPGAQCREDRDRCPFLADCTRTLPDDWTGWAPRKDAPPIRQWLSDGAARLADIPDDRPVPRGVAHARLASRGDGRYVSPGLAAALAPAGPPACYLDFECVSMGVPAYRGTSPFATVPFLWSVHRVDGRGALSHVDDIAPPSFDPPFRRIAEGLLAALGDPPTPVVVYSSYESERLGELAAALPDLEAPLRAVQARLVDLLDVVRDHVYDLGFRGSFSMKQVAPVLVPDLHYDDLAIRDGLAATLAYERLLRDGGHSPHAPRVLAQLRAYCARDTFALVRLHRALRRLAAG